MVCSENIAIDFEVEIGFFLRIATLLSNAYGSGYTVLPLPFFPHNGSRFNRSYRTN
jgi:hypothetical protein